ncbi:MAG: hypothetical protein J7L71_03860 [Spirochaetaceae bacterium]|nr:hypothetical protein [Spirochaetaceae bacterium]
MEDDNNFLIELETVLEKKKADLEEKELPVLKETIRLFTSAFEGIYSLFLKKGLIAEDPYKYEQKISDITPPSTDMVVDSEKNHAISQRLSVYDSQLDFLNNFYQFSVDFITIPRIKKIILLIRWIKWEKVSEAATDINTRIFAEIVVKITQGPDQMSIKLLKDSLKRLPNLSKKIISFLKALSMYQREKYKFDIRSKIIEELKISSKDMLSSSKNTLQKIKSNFKRIMGNGAPFYSELIKEIFIEETAPEGESLKSDLLKKLKIKEVANEKKKEINYRQLLLDSLRIISTASIPLEHALNNLDFNNALSKEKTLSFGDKFRLWFMSFSKNENVKKIIDIDIFDERISSTKTVQLDLINYLDTGRKKMRLAAAAGNKLSSTYRKLESASDDSVLSFINKLLEDLSVINNKLDPVNIYFKSEVGRDLRKNIKGVKIEVTSIKNILIKANQKKHEYISRIEEQEQLKKLGIL